MRVPRQGGEEERWRAHRCDGFPRPLSGCCVALSCGRDVLVYPVERLLCFFWLVAVYASVFAGTLVPPSILARRRVSYPSTDARTAEVPRLSKLWRANPAAGLCARARTADEQNSIVSYS